MKRIKLTRGYFALVDDEDYDRVSQFKWQAVVSGRNIKIVYACRTERKNGKAKSIPMSRFVVGYGGKKFVVDHINHNGLDNRKSNLRLVTPRQNQWNKRKNFDSKYKGTSKRKCTNRIKNWYVRIENNGKYIHRGFFKTEIEAARAYDVEAKKLFGKYACLNFPEHLNHEAVKGIE